MSKISLRSFSREFKLRLLLRLQAGESVSALCREFELAPQLIYDWRKTYLAYGAAGLSRKRGRRTGWRAPPPERPASLEPASAETASSDAWRGDALARAKKRIAELERVIGRQQADLHFFREALRLWDATSPSGGAPASTRSSRK
jgi:transposase